MLLTVVGCSGSVPGPASAASCYLVQAGGTSVVLDLGSGSLGQLQRHIELDRVDAILFSHLHPDHCMDLCGFYVALRYGPWRGAGPLPVWGPPGTAERMARAYGVSPDPGMANEFDFHTYPDDGFTIGEFRVTAGTVAHNSESDSADASAYGVRLEHDGAVLTYSGDTGPCDQLTRLAEGADLLLCEASFTDDGTPHPPNLHLTGRDAGTCAAAACVRALMLTHIPPWGDPARAHEEARSVYGGAIAVARPGAMVEVSAASRPHAGTS